MEGLRRGDISLYLITKLQNLKAIHNAYNSRNLEVLVVSNYKITKSESYSQQALVLTKHGVKLYLITKLQNLKAIHNKRHHRSNDRAVVSNYKITKSESYSQLRTLGGQR